MYTHLMLDPAVSQDPPRWPHRKGPQETHTSIHTQWLVRNPAGNCTGEFLLGQAGLFSPVLPVPLFLPVFSRFSSPPAPSPFAPNPPQDDVLLRLLC